MFYIRSYSTHSACISLKETLWPLWPWYHAPRTPSDPTRAVMKDKSWQCLFYCEIATPSSQDTGCVGRKTRPAPERIKVAVGMLRLWGNLGVQESFGLIWSHQSIDQPRTAPVRIARSCWLQAGNKRDSSFAYARQRIWVPSLFTHRAQQEKWFNAVGK